MMYNKNAVVNNSPRPCDINRNRNKRILSNNNHSVIFPRGVVHRVENGWGLTK